MAAPTKEYGLIKRNVATIQPKLSIFNDDSDEDGHVAVGKTLQKEAAKLQSRRQVKIDIQNALSEDPTVFEYDEIYDDIVRTKEQQTTSQKQAKEKKPQYIGALIKAAKVRKLEQERAVERKVQKEREAEGAKYAGKDSFVTSAYKQKMLELQELEEKERHEAQIEALTDVTKQKDLSGFYRNLYRQTLDPHQQPSTSTDDAVTVKEEEKTASSPQVTVKNEPVSPPRRELERQPRQFRRRQSSSDSSSGSISSSDLESMPKKAKLSTTKKSDESRRITLRKAKGDSSSSDEGVAAHNKTAAGTKTGDAAPSGDGTRSASSSPEMKGRLRSPLNRNVHKEVEAAASSSKSRNNGESVAQIGQSKNPNQDDDDDDIDADDSDSDSDDSVLSGDGKKKPGKAKKVKQPEMTQRERLLALFKKRTVGPVLDAALERYFDRKNVRLAAAN